MADEIERDLGLKSRLVPGSGGIFEVRVDGEVVFTNDSRGGVPDPQRVVPEVQKATEGEPE